MVRPQPSPFGFPITVQARYQPRQLTVTFLFAAGSLFFFANTLDDLHMIMTVLR